MITLPTPLSPEQRIALRGSRDRGLVEFISPQEADYRAVDLRITLARSEAVLAYLWGLNQSLKAAVLAGEEPKDGYRKLYESNSVFFRMLLANEITPEKCFGETSFSVEGLELRGWLFDNTAKAIDHYSLGGERINPHLDRREELVRYWFAAFSRNTLLPEGFELVCDWEQTIMKPFLGNEVNEFAYNKPIQRSADLAR